MKNINELIGIVNGINFDGVINQKETDRLLSWVDRSRNLAFEAKEIELISLIDKILEDRIITDQERQRLISYCSKYSKASKVGSEIYLLQGILEGIVSDGVINDLELKRLQEWMENYSGALDKYPKCQLLADRIRAIIEEVKVSDEERQNLLEMIDDQIEDVQYEAKVASLTRQVKNRKNIGMDLIDILGDDEVISKIHKLAEDELRKGLGSYYGTAPFNHELVFVSLTIIAMLHYEEGRYYESVRETYSALYNDYTAQKIEGFLRSILSVHRINSYERQVNVVLRNAIVPSYYLAAFFDFIFDIYKLNFQFELPDNMYGDFKFVFEGLRQAMLSEGDEVQVNVTTKTYKLIKTTKQLITDEKYVDSVIKLSIIIARLIDKKIWNKELKVFNPYLKQGFDRWADKLDVSSHDLESHRSASSLRSRWEPKYVLHDNEVYIAPPVHRIKSIYDYSVIKIEVRNRDEVLYTNDRPNIREIMGGYEINLDEIRIPKPLGKVTYRLFAGDEVIYDSKDNLYRGVIAFSYKDSTEIKNNTDFNGTAIFCYTGESNKLKPYHETDEYLLAQYGAHQGDSVLIGNEIFNFSSLARPGIFGEELADHYLYDPEKNLKYCIFKEAKWLVFETTNVGAGIEVNIDGKAYKAKDLEGEIDKREGAVKYAIHIPKMESGFHCITIYELTPGRRTALTAFEFAIDAELQVEVSDNGDNTYEVTVGSNIINDVITETIGAETYSPEWLTVFLDGREFFYLIPLPMTYYSLDGELWKSDADYLWIGDVCSESVLRVNNKRITELQVYGSSGSPIEEPIKLSDKTLFKEVRIGFLKTYAESNTYFLLVMMGENGKESVLICYNRCQISSDTKLEYDPDNKCLDIETKFLGRGKIYFTLTKENGEQLYKSDVVENGELISIGGLQSFIPYRITFYEKKSGLSLIGDRQLDTFKKVIYDWTDLIGKSFKITEVFYDRRVMDKLLRKSHHFYTTTLCITKKLEEGLFEGDLYTNTSKGSFYLNNINPVEVEICGRVVDGTVELSITKDGDGLLLDSKHHAIMNTLDDSNAIDIFSYIMDLKGIEFV